MMAKAETKLNQNFAKHLFSIDLRVYYEDTDAAGVVYYANYLRFMERARTEWLRHLAAAKGREVDVDTLMHGADGRRTGFIARRVDIRYDQPARLDDLMRVDACVAHGDPDLGDLVGSKGAIGGASVWLRQNVRLLRSGTEIQEQNNNGATIRPVGPDSRPLVTALVQLGCVDFETFKPCRLPPMLREDLAGTS